ncbi:alpha/beta hydrolase [Adhaeribacter radiodurans]|uniref:alpha/beta hydrolase n=1 Tax=Adhaeribacter radiodurans TaxID=2745197 RepID=UPI001C70EB2B|nr:alpha/beta hydrolase [Adhaeribacter radiodurans]
MNAQEFIPLWPKNKMPNSKGLSLKDSITNERIYQVGTPGMYAYFPSDQENKRTAVVICPGGGYARLAYVISGLQLAKWFNTIGISAFVLNYRLPNSPDLKERQIGPLQDAQRAVRLIRANAAKWGINQEKIGIMGSSAGGHLATTLGTYPEDVAAINDTYNKVSFRPNFMILISPVISLGTYAHTGSRDNLLGDKPAKKLVERFSTELQVTAATPPTFLVHATNDNAVSPLNSVLFYQALLNHKIPASLHIFPQGGHAIALRNNPGSTQLWTNLCEEWLNEMGFIPKNIESK